MKIEYYVEFGERSSHTSREVCSMRCSWWQVNNDDDGKQTGAFVHH